MPKKKKNIGIFLAVVAVSLVLAGAAAKNRTRKWEKVVYAENLDKVIATVDETPITLKDFGIYAVHEEKLVQQQALVYDSDTKKYWNTYTNGGFLKITARDAAIDLAIHDVIFYGMAQEIGLSLNEEEQEYLANEQLDFWSDLEEDQREKLAISKEEVEEALFKMALAQKMQQQFALEKGKDGSEYDLTGDAYQDMLKEHDVIKKEEMIDHIDFGNIILDHKQ